MKNFIIISPELQYDSLFTSSFNSKTTAFNYTIPKSSENGSPVGIQSTITDVLDTIGTNNIKHLALAYHYSGDELPFFDDFATSEPQTYRYFSNNLIDLFKQINDKIIEPLIVDILTCNLNNPDFKESVEKIEQDLGINIRYSLDQTGNSPQGNWILESDNIDIKNIYFTEDINKWNDTLSDIIDFVNEDGSTPADGTLLDSFKMYTSYTDFTNNTNSITPIRVTYNDNGGKTYTLEFTNTIDTDILTWGWVRLRKDGINDVTTVPSDSQQYYFELGANDIFDGNSKTIRYRKGDNSGWTIENSYTGWDATSGAGDTGNYATRIYVWGLFAFPNTGITVSNRAIVKNLSVDHGRGIQKGAGGIVRSRQDIFELYNCSSSCNFVNSNGGGLVGEWCGRAANGGGSSGIAGDILINKCTYSGVMNKAYCGGFFGKGVGGYGSNSKILVINSSFEGRMGNISYGGAIFATHLMSGEVPTYTDRLCVIANCNIKFIHNNANIASRFNGLIGEYAGNSAAIVITNIAFEMEWTYQMSGSFGASALRNIIISNSYSNLITSDTTSRNEDIPLFAGNYVSNSAYVLNTYSNQLSGHNNGGLNADGTKKLCGDYDILDSNLDKSTMLNSYESITNFTMSGSEYTWNVTSSSSAFTDASPDFPTVYRNATITAILDGTEVTVTIIDTGTEETEAVNAGVSTDNILAIKANNSISNGSTITIPENSISGGSVGSERRSRRIATTKLLFASNPTITNFKLSRLNLALNESYSIKANVKVFKSNGIINISSDLNGNTSWYSPLENDENITIIPTIGNTFILSRANDIYTISGTDPIVTNVVTSQNLTNNGLTGFIDGNTCTVNDEPIVFGSVGEGISDDLSCFMKGTKILTINGYKLVENITLQDKLICNNGSILPIENLKKSIVKSSTKTNPYLIPKGKYNAIEDLYVSKNHSIYIKGFFVPVKKIKGLKQVMLEHEFIEYYHIITTNIFSDIIIANGVEVETYLDINKLTLKTYKKYNKLYYNNLGIRKIDNYDTNLNEIIKYLKKDIRKKIKK